LLLLCWLVAAVTASPRFDPSWSRLPAGTEIPELRTSTSRTYSNGDGTFTADITPGRTGGAESGDSAQPVSTGHIQRQIYHGIWLYFRGTPELHYVYDAYEATVAYAKFDLASVPESSKIVNAEFRYYQYEYWNTVSTSVTYAAVNPDSTSNEQLYFAVRDGQGFANQVHSYVGWVVQTLNAAGNRIIGECLAQGWITLGINPTSGVGVSFGIYGDYRQTHLRLEYVVRGPDIQTSHAELTTYPLVAQGIDTAMLVLANRGLYPSDPFWAYASLGLARESAFVEPIAVGETAFLRIALPPQQNHDVLTNYDLWATADRDTLRPNDSVQLRCWSFDTTAYATEGFDEPVFPPADWLVVDGDGGTRCWTRQAGASGSHTGNGFTSCLHESMGRSNDWLIGGSVCPDRDYRDSVGFFIRGIIRLMPETLEVWAMSERHPRVRLSSIAVHDTAYFRRAVSLDTSDGDTIQVGFRMRSWGEGGGLCLDDIWFSRFFAPDTSKPPRDVVQRTISKLPALALAPNPANGRAVTVQCALAVGKRRRLTIRNVVGRAVRTFVLDPSGITQLDLRGLTPGVYFAALNAAGRPVSRKLIVTAR
jgi:hypothetical protein